MSPPERRSHVGEAVAVQPTYVALTSDEAAKAICELRAEMETMRNLTEQRTDTHNSYVSESVGGFEDVMKLVQGNGSS